ncbi:MAG: MBOAT family O-acyltransferase [Acutalibacteraceae bacterium]|nr:MBOAT family O-acyltransferase [Acutalibacteraceae bacterium]
MIFLYLFLPLNLVVYYFAKTTKARNIVMLVFSLVFYAWGEPTYVLLLVFMALCDWLISLYIEKQTPHGKMAKFGVAVMLFVNLGLLGLFKYGTFILQNLGYVIGKNLGSLDIILPIGISFYTFQLISYVVDVYRGDVPAQKNFAILLLYVSLFHQCIAGPIVRYKDICSELENRRASSQDIADGIWRFCFGLAKKAVLANAMGSIADSLLSGGDTLKSASALSLWVGVLAFSLQIYFDFSAYSDMAIGMGRMIGIHYRENFDYPYMSRSVTEFWRRWHISLGSFFRDYIYIPLGGNRKGRLRTYLNLFIVWFLTGLWHGASWNFVLWGLYFFVFILIEKLFLLRVLSKDRIVSHIYLVIVVYFGWILFKFEDMSSVTAVLKGMFRLNGNAFTDFETNAVAFSNIFIIIFCVLMSTPIIKKIGSAVRYTYMDKKAVSVIYSIGRIAIPLLLLLLSTAALVGDSYNPFLYFQF